MNPTLIDPTTTDLLVLDVHGVIFNNPLPRFLRDLGVQTGEGGDALLARWRSDIRSPFWRGELAEDDMWHQLAPHCSHTDLRADLESRYAPGPLFELVVNWPNRLWILSNHRTDWLMSRLGRFGIVDRFEMILVSDELGATKPDPAAFRPVREEHSSTSVFFVDDQHKNITAARRFGIDAEIVTDLAPEVPFAHSPDHAFAPFAPEYDDQKGPR